MDSVYISGNVILALKTAVRMNNNSVTFGFSGKKIAIAVEDVLGSLAIFEDDESTHSPFVIRLPREVMADVMVGGFMQVNQVTEKSLSVSIFKERECVRLIKNSVVPMSCSLDFKYLYNQIDPDNLEELDITNKLFLKESLPILEYAGDSVIMGANYLSTWGKGITYSRKIPFGIDMVIPYNIYKQVTNSSNPNTKYFKNKQNTFLAQNGPVFTVWRGEYLKNRLDPMVIWGKEPLAMYSIEIPPVMSCGNTSSKLLKTSNVDFLLGEDSFLLKTHGYETRTSMSVRHISGEKVISFSLPAEALKLLNYSRGSVSIFRNFIRLNMEDSILDIRSVVIV